VKTFVQEATARLGFLRMEFGFTGADRRARGRQVQMVFQDPYSSLDPRQTVGACLEEVLRFDAQEAGSVGRQGRLLELLNQVASMSGTRVCGHDPCPVGSGSGWRSRGHWRATPKISS
jgi:ABC-type microcin C transport system duplicated ATPase subunit YejF